MTTNKEAADRLCLILSRVDVNILGSDIIWTYFNISIRQALLNCWFQHGLSDYNTWGYVQKYEKYRNKVVLSKSKKTASLTGYGFTYCVTT